MHKTYLALCLGLLFLGCTKQVEQPKLYSRLNTSYEQVDNSICISNVFVRTVKGGSMLSTFGEDNTLLFKPYENVSVGDVIIYERSNETANYTVGHRVINISEDNLGTYYKTKGDNNEREDVYKVYKENVVGVVVSVIY